MLRILSKTILKLTCFLHGIQSVFLVLTGLASGDRWVSCHPVATNADTSAIESIIENLCIDVRPEYIHTCVRQTFRLLYELQELRTRLEKLELEKHKYTKM